MGSSSYITDREGQIIQHTEYIAFGETFVDEHSVSNKQPYLFNGKELDFETGLYYYGARYYDPKTSIFLNVDPLVEKTMSPYAYVNNNPVNLIDPTGMEPTPGEAARIASHVYGDKKDDILIGGWRVSKKDFGIKLRSNEGLKSQVYERVVNGKVTEYVYATAGTEDIVDWIENGKQLIGLSDQYKQAMSNAQKLSETLRNSELNFVGHSLGGGEAAANSMVTQGQWQGRKAFTFNAAGVGDLTKIVNIGWKSIVKSEKNINAYILTTDPLNLIQNSYTKVGLGLPDVNGKRNYLFPKDFSSVYNGHSMDNMLKNFGVSNPSKYNKK